MAADETLLNAVEASARALLRVKEKGGCVYACGNGGSTCDAMHLCEELVARFKRERKGIRAMHFMDPSVLTCWSNDYDFATAFERCADTFCTVNDALIAISTSGKSANVLAAVKKANEKGCCTIGLAGKDGGELKNLANIAVVIPGRETERIQEGHILVIHALCELLER